jgi:hypothetical protein
VNMSRDPDDMADLKVLGDDVPMTDDAAKDLARSRLDRAIERELAASSRIALRRWGAVAAAIIALSVATPLFLRGDALLELAAVASTGPAPSIPIGSFVYTRARVRATSTDNDVTNGESGSRIITSRRETWIAQDGSGLVLDRGIRPASEAERTAGGPGTFRYPNLDQLPTQPQALLDAIMGPGFLDEPDDGFGVLSGIGALLRDSYVSPAHREALFLIVESMEGVEVVENYRDPVGRLGIAVSLRDSTQSVTLVFEPRTSRLLAERESRDEGAFIFEASYLETAVVSARGERPAQAGT